MFKAALETIPVIRTYAPNRHMIFEDAKGFNIDFNFSACDQNGDTDYGQNRHRDLASSSCTRVTRLSFAARRLSLSALSARMAPVFNTVAPV